ncbi:gp32 [Shigella phage Buco]|uniref:dATP/dGTP diphosphohydrolase N-terminal domain-containing protein n=1 Tax=Shigella phage Buco TaxID=2530183 RepID=A0A482JJN9_9CAUD|nr:gp32 [Shigella phage Buco]QBP32932.1 hypothetical protein HRP29_gp32 [Shigella phage Buco]
MKAICIEPVRNLTKGAVYDIRPVDATYVKLIMDDGSERELFARRFQPFTEAVASPQPDLKYDQGKPRMSLLLSGCPLALEAVGQVLTFGAQKYEAHSWQTVDNGRERYESALMRHLLAIGKGEDRDSESGLHHLAHAACNALFILELELRKQQAKQ